MRSRSRSTYPPVVQLETQRRALLAEFALREAPETPRPRRGVTRRLLAFATR